MGYYYLAWIALYYFVRTPWALGLLIAFFLLRSVIPSPLPLYRAFTKAGHLARSVELNPANLTARRDLARIYLDLRRNNKALRVLQGGLERAPRDPELLLLLAEAQLKLGAYEACLSALEIALAESPRLGFGGPYLLAGDACFALGRYESAQAAYEEYLDSNGSDVAGYTRLGRTLKKLGQDLRARSILVEGLRTFSSLRGKRFRASIGAYLEAQWVRGFLLRVPHVAVGWLATLGVAALCVSLLVSHLQKPSPRSSRSHPSRVRLQH